jgi:tetratricopeptide (TPR) repeat protein
MSAKRFRIAFSFAGEKRDFVAKVADILALRFGHEAILYDKFHEAEFANADLAFDLPSLYKYDTDLIVSVFCKDYDKKEWCGLEWRAIFSMIKEGDTKQIMLSRFDHTDGKGLHGLAGFIELDTKTPEQFAHLILERLAQIEGKPRDHYTKPVPVITPILKTSIPHNLPTLQPFFGREEELKKIAEALDPDTRGWGALIDGPGGMGKTSLAVRAAYAASPDVFKKIIFISLKTRELDDDGLRDLSGFLISGLVELLSELARELGRDDLLKLPEDQRPRLLLDVLRGTQSLLVLDNLESLTKPERDTLFTFVKKLPTGCKAILTSRGRIGSGAEELILEALSQEAALATLAELATHNPHLAQTSEAERLVLYRETAGKPLLLRWTAGQLGRGHCLTFTDALDFIRSCPPENDPLEFIFGDLVEDLSEAETKVICALTYFTLPASVEHILFAVNPASSYAPEYEAAREAFHQALNQAAPAGICAAKACQHFSAAEINVALRSLVNRSLAVPSDELKYFTLVPMVADFLRKKKPEIVTESGDHLEKRAYALIIENGRQKHDHFPTLEAAWPGIAPALDLFLAGDNARLQTVCAALPDFLNFQGRWDECLALSEKAEARAVAAADHDNAGWRAYHAGMIHSQRQQADDVLTCADRATSHWGTAKAGVRERSIAIRLRGIGHQLKKDYPAAITAYRESLDLLRSLAAESEDVAIGLNSLAIATKGFDDFSAAEEHFREALRVAHAVGYAEGVAYITGNLAELSLERKDWPTAETLAREALPLAEKVGRLEMIACDKHRLAQALVRQGRAAEALPHAQKAVEIFTRLGSPTADNAQATLTECMAAV